MADPGSGPGGPSGSPGGVGGPGAPMGDPGGFGGWLQGLFNEISRQDVLNGLFPGLGWGMDKMGMLNNTSGKVDAYGGGDPNGGGGPADFFRTSTMVQKTLAGGGGAGKRPGTPPPPPIVPPPAPQKKRVGRQETILTSGLSDAPTFKPTLLGQ